MTNSRDVALQVTAQIRTSDSYANLVLPAAIRSARLTSRDAGHATDLTYGMQRWRGLIDAIIARSVTGSMNRVDSGVLDLLRLATYELVMRAEPPHIINEWVTISKKRFRRATGFVNATLRTIASSTLDEWKRLFGESASVDVFRAITFSHPAWIVDEYISLLGKAEAEELLVANNQPPVPTLVALPGLGTAPTGAVKTEFSPYGFASPGGSLADVPGVVDGVVRVQDEGSQLAALALVASAPLTAGEQWLDLCAGPGGKTALLAAFALPANIELAANEIQPHRAELVRLSLKPFRDRVTVSVADGRDVCAANPAGFTRILVDAPCTGLGALRRRPESRWRKSPDDLSQLVPLQKELLASAISALSVNGVVAYVTCSPLTAETVDVVEAVLAEHPEAEALDTDTILRTIAPNLTNSARGTAVQLYPHRHHTDAMFIQLIRRTR